MKAMILGGVAPHIELISVLKKKGYTTILVDYLDNPPAKAYADVFYQVSTLDKEAVLALAKQLEIDLIMTVCVDHANITMCYVAEQMGLPMPYPLESALLATDKTLMKARMKAYEIPTSDFVFLKDHEKYSGNLKFPLVVKPADNNGSKGVKRADTLEEVDEFVANAYELSRSGKVVVEEFNEGTEIQVDCFANKGIANVIMIKEKQKIPRTNGLAMQSFGSIIPPVLSDEVKAQIGEISQKIANAFQFEHTPFFYQAIVNQNSVRVIELSPRIGGGLSYRLLKQHADFDIMDAIIASYSGNIPDITLGNKNECMVTNIIYAVNGIFGQVTGIDEMLKAGVIDGFDLMIDRGKELGDHMDSRNRVGAYYISAGNNDELLRKSQIAHDHIDVLDMNGRSIMKKDYYYHK